jgi:hypothetical protein
VEQKQNDNEDEPASKVYVMQPIHIFPLQLLPLDQTDNNTQNPLLYCPATRSFASPVISEGLWTHSKLNSATDGVAESKSNSIIVNSSKEVDEVSLLLDREVRSVDDLGETLEDLGMIELKPPQRSDEGLHIGKTASLTQLLMSNVEKVLLHNIRVCYWCDVLSMYWDVDRCQRI